MNIFKKFKNSYLQEDKNGDDLTTNFQVANNIKTQMHYLSRELYH